MSIETLTTLIESKASEKGRAVVALSGGVDSSLVAAAAYRALGDRCVAVTVRSELTPAREFTRAAETAEFMGIEHHALPMRALTEAGVRRNTPDRCYHCKQAIFRLMVLDYGDDTLLMDGTNRDDDPARPGLRAVREFGVYSPLKEGGYTKSMVRRMARDLGLPHWDAPSESCLATRIPVGMPLTADRLTMVETMESFFHRMGVETIRATHDNLVATVVYARQYAEILDKNRDSFAALIKRIGLRSFVFKEWTGES